MSCADVCLSHYWDFDGADPLSREGFSRARKDYNCCECGDRIARGDLYHWTSGKSDGGMFRMQTCAVCAEIRKAFVCGGYVLEMLWESMREDMFPLWKKASAIDCLARLTTDAAIAKCNAEYSEWRGDSEGT